MTECDRLHCNDTIGPCDDCPRAHDTRVGWQPGPAGMAAYWAYCSCGWEAKGATRATNAEAQRDADAHASERDGR